LTRTYRLLDLLHLIIPEADVDKGAEFEFPTGAFAWVGPEYEFEDGAAGDP